MKTEKTDFLLIVVMVIVGASHLTTLQAANNKNPLLVANLGDPFKAQAKKIKNKINSNPYINQDDAKEINKFFEIYRNHPDLHKTFEKTDILKNLPLYKMTSSDSRLEQQKLLLTVLQIFPEKVKKKFMWLVARNAKDTDKVNAVFTRKLTGLNYETLEEIPESAGPEAYGLSKLAVLVKFAVDPEKDCYNMPVTKDTTTNNLK